MDVGFVRLQQVQCQRGPPKFRSGLFGPFVRSEEQEESVEQGEPDEQGDPGGLKRFDKLSVVGLVWS